MLWYTGATSAEAKGPGRPNFLMAQFAAAFCVANVVEVLCRLASPVANACVDMIVRRRVLWQDEVQGHKAFGVADIHKGQGYPMVFATVGSHRPCKASAFSQANGQQI